MVYLDNILIYSETLKDHRRHIKNVLEWLLVRQLRYKSEKCEFYKKEVDFLGFIVRVNGIKINPEKIRKILNWPESRNLKNLQRFLRFGNFNWRFISEYLFITLLLIELTKKNILFVWTTPYQEAFNKLKRVFITAFYLVFFISDKSVRIETDTLDKDVGVYLLQQDDKRI